MSRYSKRKIATNDVYQDEDLFEKRNVKVIEQYTSPKFSNPSEEELRKIPHIEHYYVAGQRMFKLSQKYYGDQKYWYIIARFNNKPTEAQIEDGEILKIPTNLQQALEVLG
jgi:hypothetical protein